MNRNIFFISLLLIVVALTGCKNKKGKSVLSYNSTGRPYELLVVIDPQLQETEAGKAIMSVVLSDVPGLPQSEPSFRRMYTSPSNFDATLKMVRNIIVVKINPEVYTHPKFVLEKNVYAEPQTILNIQAPNSKEFTDFVISNKQKIIDLFNHSEMNRQLEQLKYNFNQQAELEAKEMFGCSIHIPGELSYSKKGKDFLWFGTNTATNDRNFVMYSYPYRDKNTFTKEYFLHKRDSVMKINMPGAREGMYMTHQDPVFTETRQIGIEGEFAYEARGLWKVKGDMMGGPYVSLMRVDTKNQKVIVTEIFVYSPDKAKRNLVKQMEASLYTLVLPQNIDKENKKEEGKADKAPKNDK